MQRRHGLRTACLGAALAVLGPWRVLAQEPPSSVAVMRFGVVPQGDAREASAAWEPLLAALGLRTGRPISVLSAASEESLERAIRRDGIDIAYLSAKMALDAVALRRMRVVAQLDGAGAPPQRALLLVRAAGPLNDLQALLAQPERWRLARGDQRSVAGFIAPKLQLFLPHQIDMETRFRSELVGTHQETALAVANGDADVATSHSVEFERFRQQFPIEAARLRVVWQSEPLPPALVLLRANQPAALHATVQAFLVAYGRGGPAAHAERATLQALRAVPGFVAADDSALLPMARLDYQLARQSALAARWTSDEARAQRLARIEQQYAQRQAMLRGGTP